MAELFDQGFAPNAMPLDELPIPGILEEYMRTHLPPGYSGYKGSCYTSFYNRPAFFIVADTFEAPDGPELMLRWFSCQNTKSRGFELTEVMRESPSEDYAYHRNMYFLYMGGWRTVFRDQEKKSRNGYYGYGYTFWEKGWFNKWQPVPLKKAPGLFAYWINPDHVFTIPRYRYSGWKRTLPVIRYLQEYNLNPGIEFFGKLGIMPAKAIINKAKKDGNFRRFIRDNANHVATYGAQITLYVYKHRVSFEEAYEEINGKARATRYINDNCGAAKDLPFDRRRIHEYAQKVGSRSYNDYIVAVKYLQLDLTDTKVVFPRDFKRMHDLRINQAAALKGKRDAAAAAEYAKRFAAAAADYAFANYCKPGDAFIIAIPVAQKELVAEGNALKHCVGKMGYDNRMIAGESFIAFLRKVSEPEKPFVTIEFNLERMRISQIYGERDKKPEQAIIDFAESWSKKVAEIINKSRKIIEEEFKAGEQKHATIYEIIREKKMALGA